MKTVVLKFGGTSVGSVDKIKKVCKIIAAYKKKKNKVLVISSAMSGVTNDLVNKSKLISNNFDKAEYDTLLSTGEQASCALIAGRLNHNGFSSRSWMSWQLPILTEGPHSNARISKVVVKQLQSYLKNGGIPIITGFQGINNKLRLTTIGRSGSDASAIMLAKFIKADECIIYTDVDGVYTTDPRQYKNAKKIRKIFYDEMLEMASLGSKVMQPTSVQDAKLNNIDVQVKSSFVNKSGTLITGSTKAFSDQIITGISSTKNDAKITIVGVKDRPGIAASIFKPMSQNLINVDMVIQNISSDQKTTDITFTIKRDDVVKTLNILKNNKDIDYRDIIHNDKVSKVSIVGAGMVSTPGITYRMFRALSEEKINILAISTSEIKLSVIIDEDNTLNAIKKLHTIFDLD